MIRWMRFNAVGLMGVAVQLAALAILKSQLGLHYLVATILAVEIAVLHNFAWHERWTWRDRPVSGTHRSMRLLRFNLSTGLVSILSNLVLMSLLTGYLRIPILPANLAAIAATSIANFLVSEYFVFAPRTISGA